ncbi:RCC1 domain-containing protein [Sorangium sp. So ce1335]|uniref:RCC1 domain-containing protein n=1 Tax=Sorangium sp. So ce1335 TaxID=3133335 RepID=UPI003F63C020
MALGSFPGGTQSRLQRCWLALGVLLAACDGKVSLTDDKPGAAGSTGSEASGGGSSPTGGDASPDGRCALSVTSGAAHACALFAGGSVWCWGDNTYGQLGDGTFERRDRPVEVRIPGAEKVVAGGRHTCALAGGELWCWGDNAEGQLAGVAEARSSLPVVIRAAGISDAIFDVALADRQTCVLDTLTHATCWGTDASGVRRDPTLAAVSDAQPVFGLFGGFDRMAALVPEGKLVDISTWDRAAPLRDGADSPAAGAALGSAHRCVLKRSGLVWCSPWLGPLSEEAPGVVMEMGSDVVEIGAGASSTCARRADGGVWCHGWSDGGQLGDGRNGTPDDRAFGSGPVVGLDGAIDLSVGGHHACAVRNDGSVLCWGDLDPRAAAAPYLVSRGPGADACRAPEPAPRPAARDRHVDAVRAYAETMCRCALGVDADLDGCIAEEGSMNAACLAALPADETYLDCMTDALYLTRASCWAACAKTPDEVLPSCPVDAACARPSGVEASYLCHMSWYPCDNEQGGVMNEALCDGIRDCDDGADEANCSRDQGAFFCAEGEPLPFERVCDDVIDCENEIDELCL